MALRLKAFRVIQEAITTIEHLLEADILCWPTRTCHLIGEEAWYDRENDP